MSSLNGIVLNGEVLGSTTSAKQVLSGPGQINCYLQGILTVQPMVRRLQTVENLRCVGSLNGHAIRMSPFSIQETMECQPSLTGRAKVGLNAYVPITPEVVGELTPTIQRLIRFSFSQSCALEGEFNPFDTTTHPAPIERTSYVPRLDRTSYVKGGR